MSRKKHLAFILSIFTLTVIGSNIWFMSPLPITNAEKVSATTPPDKPYKEGRHVVVYLHEMRLELRDGKEVLQTLPLLSQGKPGSYYETIGGEYENDYKTPLHFSSIGYVYMPYSVHVFGNYFIHGVPYYPNGEKVASTHSGGCIRLTDVNAKTVYDFVTRGTPIIITRGEDTQFANTQEREKTLRSQEITNFMVATISLEALTQDNEILNTDGRTLTTRKDLLPRLLARADSSVALLYANSLGQKTYVDMMNKKAKSLGMTNTNFENVISPVETTYEDYTRFMSHISTYKSYLETVKNSTSPSL